MKEIQQEITPITNEDLFIILNHPNAHFDYPIHCHPEYEINLVMHTRGSRIVGDSTEDFGPLDLVMTGVIILALMAVGMYRCITLVENRVLRGRRL